MLLFFNFLLFFWIFRLFLKKFWIRVLFSSSYVLSYSLIEVWLSVLFSISNFEIAPLFSSFTAYTTFFIRAFKIAPAHIGHGSRVTKRVHSSNLHECNFLHAFSIAKISAWCVAIWCFSRLFIAVAITLSFFTITAPIGTSPFV